MPDYPKETLNLTPIDFAELTDDILAQGSAIRFKARGQSMKPFISDGDILTVTPIRISMLKKGDVILYRTPAGNLVAHRIHSISTVNSKTLLTVCGDSQLNSRETILADQVLGQAQHIERKGSRIDISGYVARTKGLLRFKLLRFIYLIRRKVAELLHAFTLSLLACFAYFAVFQTPTPIPRYTVTPIRPYRLFTLSLANPIDLPGNGLRTRTVTVSVSPFPSSVTSCHNTCGGPKYHAEKSAETSIRYSISDAALSRLNVNTAS
jgi:signal peptidase